MDNRHDFIKTGDHDSFSQIQDRNGEVVLSYCRRCRQAEGELADTCLGEPTGECPICGCLIYAGDNYDLERHDKLAHRVNQDYTEG